METLSVCCNHCGAPLQVIGSTRFVTCQFCHSHLEVKRADNSLFTEEVARIADNTSKMADSLEVITIQNEIERLDRENAPAMAASQGKDSKAGAGSEEGCVKWIGLIMVIAFGLFFAISSAQNGAPFIFPLFGGGIVLISIIRFFGALSPSATSGSEAAKPSRYQNQRDELLKKLASYSDK